MYAAECLVEIQLLAEVIGMGYISRGKEDIAVRDIERSRTITVCRGVCINGITHIIRFLILELFGRIIRIFILERSRIFQPVGKLKTQASESTIAEITMVCQIHSSFVQWRNIKVVQPVGNQRTYL